MACCKKIFILIEIWNKNGQPSIMTPILSTIMEPDAFKVYIDRLHSGKTQRVEALFSPGFLDVNEESLRFEKPIRVHGEAYIAEEDLVLHFSVTAEALMPCSICNEMTPIEISLPSFYEAVPLDEIKGAIYDFRECLREEILLQIPHTAECHGGSCPKRKEMAPYLKAEAAEENDGYQPFADL